nr:hypothetical protein Iba_chr07cCG7250 [Ipomoea batatas]
MMDSGGEAQRRGNVPLSCLHPPSRLGSSNVFLFLAACCSGDRHSLLVNESQQQRRGGLLSLPPPIVASRVAWCGFPCFL